MEFTGPEGAVYSVDPPERYLTFSYWIYMVPQYRPRNILMLGYAGGTVAGLIRKIYGDVPITAVDIAPCEDKYGVEFVQADAEEFCRTTDRTWDCVMLDLYNGYAPPPFIFEDYFAEYLSRITERYLIINHISTPGVWHVAKRFEMVHAIPVNNNVIYYFKKPGVELDIRP